MDSSYLLPALNIEITEGWTKKNLLTLIRLENYELFYCDLSLFEINTKCMKLILQHKLDVSIHKIQRGVNSILQSPYLKRVNWWENVHESEILLKLKEIHNDSIDCHLFYISVVLCDVFATFDASFIQKIKANKEMLEWVEEVNPEFRVWMNDLKSEKIPLK
ncbi:MAG: hypothetical protein R6U96_04120 [Promethearchaeia archaeon]